MARTRRRRSSRRHRSARRGPRDLPEGDPASLPDPPEPCATRPTRRRAGSSTPPGPPRTRRAPATPTTACWLAYSRGMCERRWRPARPTTASPWSSPSPTSAASAGWLRAAQSGSARTSSIPRSSTRRRASNVLARHGVTQANRGHGVSPGLPRRPSAPPTGRRRCFPACARFPAAARPSRRSCTTDQVRAMGGVGIVSGYGLTECPIIAMNTAVRDPDEKLAHTEGPPNPGRRCRFASSAPTARGAAGRRGGDARERPTAVPRLPRLVELDSRRLRRRRLLPHRRPRARSTDDGFVTITGRLKDVIIRKGENISAKEVEDLLHQHPSVADGGGDRPPGPAHRGALPARWWRVAATPVSPLDVRSDVRVSSKKAGLMVQKIPEQLELVAQIPPQPDRQTAETLSLVGRGAGWTVAQRVGTMLGPSARRCGRSLCGRVDQLVRSQL